MQFQPGEIVSFRKRLWRIDEILGDEFVATPIDGMGVARKRFITALEKIEAGKLQLPDTSQLGNPANQNLLLRAFKLSMIHGSAPFLSLQRSSVIPVNYQLVPLVMALENARVRLLIADDVGLGKTIEAGLILSELLARGMVKRFLIITPASLREQWKQQLSYFFHIETRILSGKTKREYEKELPAGANPWQFFQRLIVSIDYAKQTEQKFKILEQKWDLVLVDEAHIAAKPHQGTPKQYVDMDRWNLIRDLAEKCNHLLLLTATPHNGYTDTFASLIQMLNPDVVVGDAPDVEIVKSKARKFICQRSRRDIEKWFTQHQQKSPFPKRNNQEKPIPVHPEYERLIQELNIYSTKLLTQARSAIQKFTLTQWVVLHFQKRALSSPASLRASLKNRLDEIRRRIYGEEELKGYSDREILKNTVTDDDTGERVDTEEASRRTDRALIDHDQDLIHQEKMLIDLLERAKKITVNKDSKFQHLMRRTLQDLFNNDSKVIVFTRYKDTLDYLVSELQKSLKNVEVFSLYGDMSEAARREELIKFRNSVKAVLVATDVISEGLNLQHICSQIVHYELPWNPNRLEQRNGRVDRFGQPKEIVYIRTLVMDQTLDVAVLEHLINKAYRIREDRGFCPPFFGDEVNVALLIRAHKPVKEQLYLFDEISSPLEQAMSEKLFNPLDDDVIDRVASDSFYGETDISLPDIEKRLEKTQKLIGSPDQIQHFVRSALSRYGCSLNEQPNGNLTIQLSDRRLQLPGIGEKLEKASFEPEQALVDPGIIVLDLGHPLVNRLIDIVREDFFKTGAEYGRISAIVTPAVTEVTVFYHYLVRFAVQTIPVQIMEELIAAGFPVYGNKLLNHEDLNTIENTTPLPRIPSIGEVSAYLTDSQKNELYMKGLDPLIEKRMQELINERKELKKKLIEEGDNKLLSWLTGLDQLEGVSKDLLTITVYLPR